MQRAELFLECQKLNPINSKAIREILKEHEEYFRWFDEEVVLDVGCGPGDATRLVLYPWLPARARKTVLGIDISPVMKDVGNKNYKNSDVSFETFDVSSQDLRVILENDKFRDGFSKIFSFYVFHWIHDIERAFSNMYSLLKPQGQVLLMFPVSRQYQKLYKQMQQSEPWATILKNVNRDFPNYFINGDPKSEFVSIAQQAGFKVITCECSTIYEEFTNIDALKKLVGSLDSQINKIPADLQDRYLDECIEIMRKSNLDEREDGTVILSEKRITAFMEK